ncbi:unnamed protein product, partial [Durusdinium trenchii]
DRFLCLIAVCLWNFYAAICIMDHSELLMGAQDANELGGRWRLHLIAWQHLTHMAEVSGWKLFKIRPKHHMLDHLAKQVARTQLNPRRVMGCFSDESFLGYLKRIGIKCHVMNMMERLCQRYTLFLSLRWHETALNAGDR